MTFELFSLLFKQPVLAFLELSRKIAVLIGFSILLLMAYLEFNERRELLSSVFELRLS